MSFVFDILDLVFFFSLFVINLLVMIRDCLLYIQGIGAKGRAVRREEKKRRGQVKEFRRKKNNFDYD